MSLKLFERMVMKKIKTVIYSSAALAGVIIASAVASPAYSNSFTDTIKSFFKVDEEKAPEKIEVKKSPKPTPVSTEQKSESPRPVEVEAVSQSSLYAEEQIVQKLVEEPNNVNYHFELGQLKLLKGDVDGAKSTFTQLSMMSGGSKLGLIGLVLIDLFLGETNQAYQKISQSGMSSDPEVLVLSSWCMFLGGTANAAEGILNNASKVTDSRVALGILATFYAVSGNYDLAQTTLVNISKMGFLPLHALLAKYLIASKFGQNEDAVADTFSEFRNKFQLTEPVSRMILGYGLMLELNYPAAFKQYQEVEEGDNLVLRASAKRISSRINNIADALLVQYHRSLMTLALKQKSREQVKRLLNVSPRAVLVLLAKIEDNPQPILSQGTLDEFVLVNFGANWYREKLLSLMKDNSYVEEILNTVLAKKEIDFSIWKPWNYFHRIALQENKKYTDEELDQLINEIANLFPTPFRAYAKLELYLVLFSNGLILRGDVDKVQEYYGSFESFENFLFSKITREQLEQFPDYSKVVIDARIKKKLPQIVRGVKAAREFKAFDNNQSKAMAIMEQIRNNPKLSNDEARGLIAELKDGSCIKIAIEYYLSRRYNLNDSSTKFQEYLTCTSQLESNEKSVDRSGAIVAEALYVSGEYEALVKFYRENEAWLATSSGYSAVHYIDALGRLRGFEEAKLEAKRVCAIIEADFCIKINSDVMPELERRRNQLGVTKANELLTKAKDAIDKKQYSNAYSLLVEARKQNPMNPYVYMYFESLYRIDPKFDFLTQYTELVTAFLTNSSLDSVNRSLILERIFKPCEDVNLPCETLISVVRDGRFKDVPDEVIKPAFAAQLIRAGELEVAKKVVDEMTQSENLMLQRKGLKLKTTLTEIFKRVRDSSSFDKKILQEIEKTSV